MTPPKLVVTNRSYEELEGGQGREVFFRPHRYRAQDLAPVRAVVEIAFGSQRFACGVFDVSQNGVAFEWPADVPVHIDLTVHLDLRFDSHTGFRGEARVGSIRHMEDGVLVGVSFRDFLLDTDELLQLREVRLWGEDRNNSLGSSQQPWHIEGQDRYKALVAEFALFLEDAETRMNELERRLTWRTVHGEQDSVGWQALVSWIDAEFTPEVIRYIETIDAAMRGAPASHVPRLAGFTRRYLEASFMKAPWMFRARQKPFGYPGDYEVMRFYYERTFEGATLFAKAFHYATIRCKGPQAVVKRKDLIHRKLREMIEMRAGADRPLRVLSVAAGPAQELYELLSGIPGLGTPLDIVLFDQDKGALAYAYRRLKPVVEKRFPERVRLLYLHESIKRLLRDRDIFSEFGEFDAIFSSGLNDYLSPPTATVLTRNLYARLQRGGRLWIGNMAPENPNRWAMETLLEWNLLYRTRAELTEIGSRAVPEAPVRILEEETGINPFIEIVKE